MEAGQVSSKTPELAAKMPTGDCDTTLAYDRFFILLKGHQGEIILGSKSILEQTFSTIQKYTTGKKTVTTSVTFSKGELFKLFPNVENVISINEKLNYPIDLQSVKNPNNFLFKCESTAIRELNEVEFGILFAISSHIGRFDALENLDDASKIQVGDIIKVTSKKSGQPKQGTYKQRAVARNPGLPSSVYFGVKFEEELVDSEYMGENTSSQQKDKSIIYYPFNRIIVLGENERKKSISKEVKSSETEKKTIAKLGNQNKSKVKLFAQQDLKKDKNDTKLNENLHIPIGTRVVCFPDNGYQAYAGELQYLDHINGSLMAGVELDKKYPHQPAHYNNYVKKLFNCKPGFGLIVERQSVMMESDYLGPSEDKKTTVNDDNRLGIKELESKGTKQPTVIEQQEKFNEQHTQRIKTPSANANPYNLGQNNRNEEKMLHESELANMNIQGILNDIDKQLPSSEFLSKQSPTGYIDQTDTSKSVQLQGYGYGFRPRNIENSLPPKLFVDDQKLHIQPTPEQLSLQEGSMVVITIKENKHYGVLKWKDEIPKYPGTIFAGVELDNDDLKVCNDGFFLGAKRFNSPLNRAFFLKLHQCHPDSRFVTPDVEKATASRQIIYPKDEPVKGSFLPITELHSGFLGSNKGIQGHYNSCYMDSCLFAMFGYSFFFDVMLHRKRRVGDIKEYETVQTILKEHIVNPLRKKGFVGHPSVLELRKWLNDLGDIGGFMTEEKDPEEFIVLLFEKVLNVDPFVRIRGYNTEDVSLLHLYQIFCEKDETNILPTIQYLLEYSFLSSSLKLADVPSVMILQMPRFGQEKVFKRIQITSTIDITPLVAGKSHDCVICGHQATTHCPDCACLLGKDIVHTYLCDHCWGTVHTHPNRKHEKPLMKPVDVTTTTSSSHPVLLELFAVVCIEKSHYVSFVKCGSGDEEKWLFFDSMADRVGGENGYNIPQVTLVDNLKHFLNGTPQMISELDRKVNEQIMRVFDDASLCFYCNRSLSMYR